MRVAAALIGAATLAGCSDDGLTNERVAAARSSISVAEAVDAGCSTASVAGLSLQIIAQANCIEPGAFSEVPPLANVTVGSNVFAFLEEPARDAFVTAVRSSPSQTMTVNSMLRTVAQQLLLHRWYQQGTCGISLAATPGSSNHETGLALDISEHAAWRPTLEAHGFSWLGSSDPVHFDYTGAGAIDHRGLDVLAFQMLWNANHPEDLIGEDGEYGPETEARLLAAPAEGFDKTLTCGASAAPDLAIELELRAPDVFDDDASAGVSDWFESEPTALELRLENRGGVAADQVHVALEVDEADLTLDSYAITHAPSASGPFEPDPANALPENPAQGALEARIDLALGPMAAGEHKHITVSLTPQRYTADRSEPVRVLAWVTRIDERYVQTEHAGPVQNDGSQTFGEGRLELSASADVYSRTRWEWESDRLEGASTEPAAPLLSQEGSLLFQPQAAGARLVLPAIELEAGEHRVVRLAFAEHAGSGAASLLVRRADEPLGAAERVPFEAAVGREVEVAIGDGPVTQLAIEPFADGGGELALDFVRIEPSAAASDDADQGCACRSAGSSRSPSAWLLLALVLGSLRRRQRQP